MRDKSLSHQPEAGIGIQQTQHPRQDPFKRQDRALAEISGEFSRLRSERKALRRQLERPDQRLVELERRFLELNQQAEALHADRARLFSEQRAVQALLKAGLGAAVRGAAGSMLDVAPALPAGGLRALLATEGLTAFDFLGHTTVLRGERSGIGDGDAPDFLVVPRPERPDLAGVLDEVPHHIWTRVAAGETRLVFDGSPEGVPHSADMTMRLHREMAARGVSVDNAAYLTQDRLYDAHYRAFCEARGLRPMPVLNHDYFIHRALFVFQGIGEKVFNDRYRACFKQPHEGRRRFLSLNLTPRAHKVLFLLRLLHDGLWDEGFVSFGGFDRLGRANEVSKSRILKEMRRMEGFDDAVAEVAPLLHRLDEMGPMLLGMPADADGGSIVKESYWAVDLPEYRRSRFSVVTESEMSDRLHRITEKTLKPLLNAHPFIVLGNPGSLDLVRDYGFQTFAGVFDETYDQEPDRRRRFEMVYAEIVRVIRMDDAKLRKLEIGVEEVVRFNLRWGLVDLPRIFQQQISADLIGRLMMLGGAG